ncbi:GNAT family N-acetyltransferase [Streptomyces sp. NPDC058867]|uniref:GNAT family N-acetyltransferase n=1 Tax=unclassified Streptomyces TaxID=2593676 RepID=UPI00367DE4E4
MPPHDASTDAGTDSAASVGTDTAPGVPTREGFEGFEDRETHASTEDTEDTLDLRLPDEFLALIASGERADGGGAGRRVGASTDSDSDSGTGTGANASAGAEDVGGGGAQAGAGMPTDRVYPAQTGDDLLDRVADWGPITTGMGVFHLVPVGLPRDLPLLSRWMNDPAAAAFWELAGPQSVAEGHVRSQLEGDGRSVPCVGVLDGTPMSYWEIYRADLDPLARHYPARPHDTGIHLLIGDVVDRGRGLGATLLRAVADRALDVRPACARVVAEPDVRNTPSISAFLSAGFRFAAEVDLPAKRAALMVRDRALRDVL